MVDCLEQNCQSDRFRFPASTARTYRIWGVHRLHVRRYSSHFHSRIISFDKAVRKRVGSVRNVELSDYLKFSDLKIAHVDSVGVSACAEGSAKWDQTRRQKRGKGWKRSEPCNKWNDGTCGQKEEDCRRNHVCNRCEKRGHKGKECRNPSN